MIEWLASALKDDEVGNQLHGALAKVTKNDNGDGHDDCKES